MNAKVWWYATRSAGITAWCLLALSVLWGLALSTKAFGRRPRPNWLLDLHRYLGGLAIVFTAVHVITILVDTYVSFSLVNVLVPLTGHWHPNAVAWGIVSMYALVAVEVTSLLRRRLSKRVWRAVHYLSFPLFATATIHVLTAGTDRHTVVLRAVIMVTVLAVTTLTSMRLWKAEHHDLLTSPRTPPRPGRQNVRDPGVTAAHKLSTGARTRPEK